MSYYVYLLINKYNDTVFYVGISGCPFYNLKESGGVYSRAYSHINIAKDGNLTRKSDFIRSINFNVSVFILKENLSKEEAIRFERFLINYYGRLDLDCGILYNETWGGDGIDSKSLCDLYKLGRGPSQISLNNGTHYFLSENHSKNSSARLLKLSENGNHPLQIKTSLGLNPSHIASKENRHWALGDNNPSRKYKGCNLIKYKLRKLIEYLRVSKYLEINDISASQFDYCDWKSLRNGVNSIINNNLIENMVMEKINSNLIVRQINV